MSVDGSKHTVPLWAYREPPAGLSAPWERVYRALVDPITIVLTFRPDFARRGTRELLAGWYESLRRSEEGAAAVLQFLHGPSQRTWKVGHAIQTAITSITGALCSAVRFLDNPTPTRSGEEATANSLRANIADKLSRFDGASLLDELAAAIVADCVNERLSAAPPQPAGPPAPPGVDDPPATLETELTAVEKAMVIYVRDPNRTLREVARQVGCHPSLLSRDPRIQRLRQANQGTIPKGSKTKEGDLEAEAEEG